MNNSDLVNMAGKYGVFVIAFLLIAIFHKQFLRFFTGTIIVAQDEIGIVNKKWALGKSKSLPDGALIAMNGEAGIQADTLAPGVHFGLFAWQYEVELAKFIKVEQGKVGVVVARDGRGMSNGRVLGKTVDSNSFQDARSQGR